MSEKFGETPEELSRKRTLSDAEKIKSGAKYARGNAAQGPRLEFTRGQRRIAHEEMEAELRKRIIPETIKTPEYRRRIFSKVYDLKSGSPEIGNNEIKFLDDKGRIVMRLGGIGKRHYEGEIYRYDERGNLIETKLFQQVGAPPNRKNNVVETREAHFDEKDRLLEQITKDLKGEIIDHIRFEITDDDADDGEWVDGKFIPKVDKDK